MADLEGPIPSTLQVLVTTPLCMPLTLLGGGRAEIPALNIYFAGRTVSRPDFTENTPFGSSY